MARTARQISNLVIDEISLVDKGANQHAVVTIAKNADGENKEDEMDLFDEQGNKLDADQLQEGDIVYNADGEAFSMEYDDDETETNNDNGDDDGDDADVEKAFRVPGAARAGRAMRGARARVAQNESFRTGFARGRAGAGATGAFAGRVRNAGVRGAQRVTTPVRQGAGVIGPHAVAHRGAYAGGAGAALGGGGVAAYDRRNSFGKSADYVEEIREELSKALTDADREEVITKALGQVGYLAEEVEIAKAAAEEERQLRLEREYTEIAKSYNLPIADEDLGRVLMNCAEALPKEDCEIIHKAFEAAGAAIFEEYGQIGGGDNVDVYGQVEAYLDQNVSKSGTDRAEEMTEFFTKNPEIYDEYLAGY